MVVVLTSVLVGYVLEMPLAFRYELVRGLGSISRSLYS